MISLLLWLRQPTLHWVNVSGCYLLAVFVLSTIYYHWSERIRNWLNRLISVFSFIAGYYLLAGFFMIILQRFFRIEESFALYQLPKFITTHHFLWIDAIMYWMIYTGIFHWIRTHYQLQSVIEINSTLEKENNAIHRDRLRKELNPHFLFNAMNSIAMKVRINETHKAVEMIAALNVLLRSSLRPTSGELITMENELQLLKQYLLIEKERFDDAIDLSIDFPANTHEAMVPEMLLQPLVENAFKHIQSMQNQSKVIRLEGHINNNQFIIRLFNTSQAARLIMHQGQGIGLPNIVSRLRRIYGLDFQFISQMTDTGILFVIHLPYRTS